MNADPVISFRELAVGYGRQPVLSGMTLAIERGSFIGLLGANGSGKTTLLKTMAGILPPVAGEITTAPNVVTGYVPQRESLDAPFPFSSIELVQLGLCGCIPAGRFLSRKDRAFAWECLRQTGAENLARKAFVTLSGGQKQKVLIARALAARPDVLLLDEPTAGIDPEATGSIAALLRNLNSAGKTIVMVNHDLPVVSRVTDTVWWVRSGRIDIGPTGKMLNQGAVSACTGND